MEARILVKGRFSKENIEVVKDLKSKRVINNVLESKMRQRWEDELENSSKTGRELWESQMYRLDNFYIENDKLVLEVGVVPYSVVFTMRNFEEVEDLGELYFSKGMFSVGLIRTNDSKYIFAKKAYDHEVITLIGGAIVKDEMEISTAEELEIAFYKEIKEEINIDRESIIKNEFVGIIFTSSYSVGLIYEVELNLSSAEVENKFKEQNDGELSELKFIDANELNEFLKVLGGYREKIVELIVNN